MDSIPVHCEVNLIHEDLVAQAQAKMVDGATATHLANTFAALSDPTRVRLISALMDTELCVCDLAALLGMTQSAISHQLRILRNLDIVRTRKDGRIVFYTLSDDHIRELFQRGLEHVQHG
jgi:DNA-binding transcriptional ArsR family regulator